MKVRKTMTAILKVCAYLILCFVVGLVVANIIAKPIALSEDEIGYYTDTAEKVWYDGLEKVQKDDTININISVNASQVQISPVNTTKQRLTVDFSDSEPLVILSKPIVSFYGCLVSYGLIFGSIIYFLINFIIFCYKEE